MRAHTSRRYVVGNVCLGVLLAHRFCSSLNARRPGRVASQGVSTFMGFAVVDLAQGGDPDVLLDGVVVAVADPPLSKRLSPLAVWIDGTRVSFFARWGNAWLGEALVAAAGRALVDRMIVGLDHDEYGAEHVVFGLVEGQLRRLQHIYVYPGGAPDDESGPSLLDVPALDGAQVGDDGTVDGVVARAAVASAYGVPVDRVESTSGHAAVAHRDLYEVFTPFAPWWDAVGITYPVGSGEPDRSSPSDRKPKGPTHYFRQDRRPQNRRR